MRIDLPTVKYAHHTTADDDDGGLNAISRASSSQSSPLIISLFRLSSLQNQETSNDLTFNVCEREQEEKILGRKIFSREKSQPHQTESRDDARLFLKKTISYP